MILLSSPILTLRKSSDDSSESSPISKAVTRQSSNFEKAYLAQVYLGDPKTILRDGNSDPFGALAVPVGPKINALMEYTRDFYLPGIQRDVNDPGSKVVGPEWATCVCFLQDKGLAYSHFARIAAIVASDPKHPDISHDFSTQALIFKSKSMAMLRKRLQESPEDWTTYNQILLLMNAEVYDRNFVAAASHGAILVNLLQNGTIKDDPAFLFKVLYNDTQRAAMSLTRPLFDLEKWVPDQILSLSDLVTPRLPVPVRLEAQAMNLDHSLDSNPPLKDTLIVFKHACLCLALVIKDKSFADSHIVFYGRFHMTITMGRLINYYLDAAEVLTDDICVRILDNQAVSQARMSAFVSLAALLLLRCITRIDSVKISGDIALFSANKLIMQRLKDTLVASKGYAFTQRGGTFANARLYALFVGAWLEQARVAAQRAINMSSPGSYLGSPDCDADLGWFNREFAEQARAMNLYGWTEAKETLQQFVYIDVLEPNGAGWFPRILQTRQSSLS